MNSKWIQLTTVILLTLALGWSKGFAQDSTVTQQLKEADQDSARIHIQWKEESQIQRAEIRIDLAQKQRFELGQNIRLKKGVEISPSKEVGTFVSEKIRVPVESPDPFLAVGSSWTGEGFDEANVAVSIRGSLDGKTWGEWMEVQVDEHATPQASEASGNLVFLDKETRYIQYRIVLQKKTSKVSPLVTSLRFIFISPGATPEDVLQQIQMKKAKSEGSLLRLPAPTYVSRTSWGCPEGQRADLLNPKWTPQTTSVTHLIVHHTAGSNSSTDWPAVVRAIWTDHKYYRDGGWGDIGYNWLIDPNGVVYQGRSWWINGDDTLKDVMGAHFCSANTYTMGVALLGTFTSVSPTTKALTGLKNLLAWKCDQRNLDPLGITYHPPSGLSLKNISGHRDGCATQCPGDNLYAQLPTLRNDVKSLLTPVQLPTVVTRSATYVTATAATINGEITNTGGANIGMCPTYEMGVRGGG